MPAQSQSPIRQLDHAVRQYSVTLAVVPYACLALAHFNYTRAGQPSVLQAVLKVAPIVWLAVTLKLNGLRADYDRLVFAGLLVSTVGDVALVWPRVDACVVVSMVAFSAVHSLYSRAFGFEPTKTELLVRYCLPIGVGNYLLLYFSLRGMFAILVPIYSLFILTMFWRCLAAHSHKPCQSMRCALTGAVLFLISDSVLGVELFTYPDLLSARVFRYAVLNTYYGAQLAFALSVLLRDKDLIGHRVLSRIKKLGLRK